MILDLLQNKNRTEKANIKATEIAKCNFGIEKYKDKRTGIELEIFSVQKIDGGIQVLARAWKNGKQLGFGDDGSVDIERFKIFNPPILVPDDNGDIIKDSTNPKDGKFYRIRYREDLVLATQETLAHTALVIGKENTKIETGKIGNTTSTFYPDAHPESTTWDGMVRTYGSTGVFATARATTTAKDSYSDSASEIASGLGKDGNSNYDYERAILGFDTSTLGSGASISSAVLSLYPHAYGANIWKSCTFGVFANNTRGSNTGLTTSDFNISNFGTTDLATRLTLANAAAWTTGAYHDFTLNASGISNINKTATSWFGWLNASNDVDNVDPSGGNDQVLFVYAVSADGGGTSTGPKLVVTYTVAAGPTNLKSLDTNVKANIKSYNTNLIANVKSINTNA